MDEGFVGLIFSVFNHDKASKVNCKYYKKCCATIKIVYTVKSVYTVYGKGTTVFLPLQMLIDCQNSVTGKVTTKYPTTSQMHRYPTL